MPLSDFDRIAAIRGRMAAATPRITRRHVAQVVGLSEHYVVQILSGHKRDHVTSAIERMEKALDILETSHVRSRARSAAA